jgi:hypothetical protein
MSTERWGEMSLDRANRFPSPIPRTEEDNGGEIGVKRWTGSPRSLCLKESVYVFQLSAGNSSSFAAFRRIPRMAAVFATQDAPVVFPVYGMVFHVSIPLARRGIGGSIRTT